MAGQFEIFTDAEAKIRFRLLAADGTVLAISKAFEDKRQAANGIMAVRECAGTGLIREDRSSNPWAGHHGADHHGTDHQGARIASQTPVIHHHHRHLPAV
ncbi:YegP family protein [Arthrobacter sp. NPDC058130]|uniref:YegP family protein n=1 Tax=Arthrobacter sp. NPDC058130 TaxID=3346353 RepID=UPI0036E9EA19